ncbi:hypothetical protein EJB05_09282, partial [Eragrostis curvula]
MNLSRERGKALEDLFRGIRSGGRPARAYRRDLEVAASTPGFALALVAFAVSPDYNVETRVEAAIYFTKMVRRHWPKPGSPELKWYLPASDCAMIQKHLVGMIVCVSEATVREELSEGLAAAAAMSNISDWDSLIPNLVSDVAGAVSAGNVLAINALLTPASALFSRFRREEEKWDWELLHDLYHCIEAFGSTLYGLLISCSGHFREALNSGDGYVVKPLCTCLRICSDILYSFSTAQLPSFVKENMASLMSEFLFYLSPSLDIPVEAADAFDSLQMATCELIELYADSYEEFTPYLAGFIPSVWHMITSQAGLPSRSDVCQRGVSFLIAVAESCHHAMLGCADGVEKIFSHAVAPNLRLRTDVEVLFDSDWASYIGVDSDEGTLRYSTCMLLRALAVNYPNRVAALVSRQIKYMISACGADRVLNWREKDGAVFLVTALMHSGGTAIVDMEQFFWNVIMPELHAPDWKAEPVLKATVLRFMRAFKFELSKTVVQTVLPSVVRFLSHKSNVVHTYAALFIEDILNINDKSTSPEGHTVETPRYAAFEFNSHAPEVIENISSTLAVPRGIYQNYHLMRCLCRVLLTADIGYETIRDIMLSLTTILFKACECPQKEQFFRFLFEALVVMLGRIGERDQSYVHGFEFGLLPVLRKIIAEQINEFWQFTLHVSTQLILMQEAESLQASVYYTDLFHMLFNDDIWSSVTCIPAVARLLRAFLKKMPNIINQIGYPDYIIAKGLHLIKQSGTESDGFYILNSLVEFVHHDTMDPFLKEIWSFLASRLESRSVNKLQKHILIFMCNVLACYSSKVLVYTINAAKPNLFTRLLNKAWFPGSSLIQGELEVKLVIVASTKLLCESAMMLDNVELWGSLLNSVLSLMFRAGHSSHQESEGMATAYAIARHNSEELFLSPELLPYTESVKNDLFRDVESKQFFITSLAALSGHFPGRMGPLIQQYLSEENRKRLHDLAIANGSSIL